MKLDDDLLCEAAALAAAEAAANGAPVAEFYETLRRSALPFAMCEDGLSAEAAFRRSFTGAYALGRASVPLAIAFTMHAYMLGAIASFPLPAEGADRARRRMFLDLIVGQRALVANSGSDSTTRSDNTMKSATEVRRTEGGFAVRGHKTFVSLASVADMVIFTGTIENEGTAAFLAPLKGNPAIRLGESPFQDAMALSGTRTIHFEDLALPELSLLSAGEGLSLGHAYQRAWFEATIPAVYLGAAARALDEWRDFARATRLDADTTLAELDGVAVDTGRLVIEHKAALAACDAAATALSDVRPDGREAASIARFAEAATVAKYVGTGTAERVVAALRRLIGTRAMAPGHPVGRLSMEVMYGPLHPQVAAQVERAFGRGALGLGGA